MSCFSRLTSLHYERRENTYSTTVVSQIRLRISACTLSLVMFNAEQLETSLWGPGLDEPERENSYRQATFVLRRKEERIEP